MKATTTMRIEDLTGLKIFCVEHGMTITGFVNIAIKKEMDRMKGASQ